jgi:DNA-binding NtrC family response regulator
LQAKLLRTIESGEFERVGSSESLRVDVRVIAATNADLRTKIRDGSFREDLYYRLNTVEIRLPPLRDRREDIVPLAEHFLAIHSASYGHSQLSFSPEVLDALRAHSWPGNVRQLEHAIERAVLLARDGAIHVADLDPADHGASDASTEGMTLEEVERALIRRALARARGKVTEAAAALGLSRSALYRRLVKYGWDRDESDAAN